jgi:hypothetical protein
MAIGVGSVAMSTPLFSFGNLSKGLDCTVVLKGTHRTYVGLFCDKVQFESK